MWMGRGGERGSAFLFSTLLAKLRLVRADNKTQPNKQTLSSLAAKRKLHFCHQNSILPLALSQRDGGFRQKRGHSMENKKQTNSASLSLEICKHCDGPVIFWLYFPNVFGNICNSITKLSRSHLFKLHFGPSLVSQPFAELIPPFLLPKCLRPAAFSEPPLKHMPRCRRQIPFEQQPASRSHTHTFPSHLPPPILPILCLPPLPPRGGNHTPSPSSSISPNQPIHHHRRPFARQLTSHRPPSAAPLLQAVTGGQMGEWWGVAGGPPDSCGGRRGRGNPRHIHMHPCTMDPGLLLGRWARRRGVVEGDG